MKECKHGDGVYFDIEGNKRCSQCDGLIDSGDSSGAFNDPKLSM